MVQAFSPDRADQPLRMALSRRPGGCGSSGGPVANRMKKISYSGYRFPPTIIQQAIWLYLRFTLSLRDVEVLLAERGIAVSCESIRRWIDHLGPLIAADLRRGRPKPHTSWRLDEVYLKIDGRMVYGTVRLPFWVRRVVLRVRRSLPVYPREQTWPDRVGTSHSRQMPSSACRKPTTPARVPSWYSILERMTEFRPRRQFRFRGQARQAHWSVSNARSASVRKMAGSAPG